jgi:hypothetical protein
MLVYAAVPTQGLATADAKNYAVLLRYAAQALQAPGTGQGKLPPGYLPMTAANGLGAQAHYTVVAADAVAAQRGAVPALDAQVPPPPSGSTPSGPSSGSGSSVPTDRPSASATPAGGGAGGPSVTTASTSPAASSATSPTPTSDQPSTPAAVPAGYTQGLSTGGSALIIPVLAGLVLLAGVAALVVRLRARAGGPS